MQVIEKDINIDRYMYIHTYIHIHLFVYSSYICETKKRIPTSKCRLHNIHVLDTHLTCAQPASESYTIIQIKISSQG